MKSLPLLLFSLVAAHAAPPNLVLIYADDLGWKDVGYNGSDYHETPYIDRMAREGMLFHLATRRPGIAHPAVPRCFPAPTRRATTSSPWPAPTAGRGNSSG